VSLESRKSGENPLLAVMGTAACLVLAPGGCGLPLLRRGGLELGVGLHQKDIGG